MAIIFYGYILDVIYFFTISFSFFFIVGQTDAMPQIEEVPEMTEVQDEVCPKVNGEPEENEATDKTSAAEEKVAEEKSEEANEVGFKKIFRFVGFKFTLKKDKNEKTEPVQLLTVKETEDGAVETPAEKAQKEAEAGKAGPESGDESKTDAAETPGAESPSEDVPATHVKAENEPDGVEVNPVDEQPVEEVITSTDKDKEADQQDATTSVQEVQSPLKRFFTQGIFSNLRKKTSFKKTKEEEPAKEKPADEDIKEGEEEKVEEAEVDGEQPVEEKKVSEQASAPEETENVDANPEEASPVAQESEKKQLDLESKEEQTSGCTASESPEVLATDTTNEAQPAEEEKPVNSEEQPEKSPVEEQPEKDTTEADVLSSQEKAKTQGSPLKKLFTGAGLKKLSAKKQKGKKEADSKLAEPGEQASEQIQSSTELTEAPKPSSEVSSPEESSEHAVPEEPQAEVNAEAEGEAATSDSEKKKDGILPWASFKKLVTPKKRVKRSSESDEDVPADKSKSATLSSTESAGLEEKTDEANPSVTATDEAKEESQPETKTEKLEQSTEEPKRKMDTSVSWEALICVGSSKKRARKMSDSDEEEAKIEEETKPEDQAKTSESPIVSSVEADHENVASSPEPEGELVSTWESFKRLVTQRKKPKTEDKSDDSSAPEQTTSDSEIPKEESSFSLRKLIPRRKKKSDGKQGQTSSDVGSAEEDSDTPAVVPLSEYDTEQSEKVSPQEPETESLKPEIIAVTPGKVSAEDRSPSWISTTVEGIEDDADAKLLSDIPEEGDAATPKSADNTIADEIVEFTSEALTAHEPVEETEMVSALSRITGSPVTSGEASPVPGDRVSTSAEVVLQKAVETITVTEDQTSSTTALDVPLQVEAATQEKEVELVVHEKIEASTVRVSLEMNKIEEASLEAVSEQSEALSVEVAVEDQTSKPEEVEVTEEKVCEIQVHEEVQAICQEEALKEMEEIQNVTESVTQTGTESQEIIVTTVQETETLEDVVEATNTTETEVESPIKPVGEASVCKQIAEVTEVAIAEAEEVQKLENVEESIAVVSPVVEVEVLTTQPEDSVAVTGVSQEALVPVTSAGPEEVCPKPSLESETQEVVKVADKIEDSIKFATVSVSVVKEISEEVQEDVVLSQVVEVTQTEAIQVQSTVIVQEVIQNVVENLEMLNSVSGEEHQAMQEETEVSAEVEKLSPDIQEQEALIEETQVGVEEEQAQVVTEISLVSNPVQISETVVVSTADEIKPEQKEIASVSVEATQERTTVEKQEMELQACDAKEETESQDGAGKIEAHQDTPVLESDLSDTVSTMQIQNLAIVSQQVPGGQIEMTTDIHVGIVQVVDADKIEKKAQKEDTAQRVLEEVQTDVSAKDIKADESSVVAMCQKTPAAAEATTNTVQDEAAGIAEATETSSMS